MKRRAFLQISATAAGGLLIGFACRSKEDSQKQTPSSALPTKLNAWIEIAPDDTTTLTFAAAEMGQGVMTSLTMILAEELDADWTKVRAAQASSDPVYGDQLTGGSRNVRGQWDDLKKVAAQARAMLIAAAATRLGVPASELTTEASVIKHAKGSLRYGEIAAEAAKETPPDAPTFKSPDRYHLVGKPTARLDVDAKVHGAAVYGLDVRLPGMAIAQIERPPQLGGKVAKLDDTKARAVPGVRDVVQVPSGVAVIADHFWAAKQGRAALVVEWAPGDATLSSTKISKTLATLIEQGKEAKRVGEPEKTLSAAKTRLKATYEVPYLAHATMEPLNATASITKDGCEIWAGCQAVGWSKQAAAKILGCDPEKVVIHTTFLGGGFGRRGQTDFIEEAVHVAKAAKVPVKLVWTREDDMRGGWYRPAVLHAIEAGLDGDGWPSAWLHKIAAPSILEQVGFLGPDGIDQDAIEGIAETPYALPHQLVHYAKLDAPMTPWFWRSVGNSHGAWAVEHFLDELARAGGKDPLEVRRRLLANQPRQLAVVEAVVKAAGAVPTTAGRARGLASHASFGSHVAEIAEVSLENGVPKIHHVWCAIDCGSVVNPDTVRAQMESGIIYGLSAALHGAIAIEDGKVATGNFDTYPVVRMREAPVIDVVLVESTEKPGGVGEPGVPPIAPAVSNALLQLTGKPVRRLPIQNT